MLARMPTAPPPQTFTVAHCGPAACAGAAPAASTRRVAIRWRRTAVLRSAPPALLRVREVLGDVAGGPRGADRVAAVGALHVRLGHPPAPHRDHPAHPLALAPAPPPLELGERPHPEHHPLRGRGEREGPAGLERAV